MYPVTLYLSCTRSDSSGNMFTLSSFDVDKKEQKVDTWLSVDQLSFSIFKSLEDGRRVVSD